MSYTLVALHAHPDDEALFTGGTIARCAAEGHRVVLVVATAGERGLTGAGTDSLGERRRSELGQAAAALGVARVVELGYGDSGFAGDLPPGAFCTEPVEAAAARVAEVLVEEQADALTVYDAAGGYGHRDHVRVRAVGLAAAERAKTSLVLEATVARESLQRGLRWLNRLGLRPGGMTAADLDRAYVPRAAVTHELDVRRWVPQKRRALAAHASQTTGGTDVRTVALLARLPLPLARVVLGREWFVEIGRSVPRHPLDDLFASLR
ncbi:MAG TPA: PIG-L family deacetylase [Mycobacteriales bacterium]|nr:PIG-L family deacetylase [Mycobacteriales bacterium]